MKDLPHHIKKLNRQVIRSMHREELEEEAFDLDLASPRKQTPQQKKKQAKQKIKTVRRSRVLPLPTPEAKNRKMKKRVPIFDQNKSTRRIAKRTRKKTPRI